ncbi:MAG: tetratricopeptide repeat protein [Bacteroidetes bacterium]|nr:tetratricopeptide repeat protein [Bacteroidota bacterium]
MKNLLRLIVPIVLLVSCKGGQQSSSSKPASKSSLSDSQRTDVTYLFFNANKEKILGNLNNAADLFAEVIRKDGSNHASMYELANIYAEQKKYSDALFFIRSAYKLDSKNEWYAMSFAEILQKNGKFEESATVYEQLLKDKPDRLDYYFEWASALIYANKLSDAIKVLDKLEAKIGVNKDVVMQKQRLYMQLGKTDKAIAEVQKLIDENPKDAQAYGMLAELYQNIGQKEKALEIYNKVLEIDPENPYIHLSLADYYRTNGDKEKSVAELKKAFGNKKLDIDTKIQILASYYALIELHPEMKEQALEMSKLLIEANPEEPRAHAVYGDFLIQDKQYDKALDEYQLAKKLGAKEFTIAQQLMFLESQLQRWDSLLTESEETISNFPDQPLGYFFNGLANSQKKKYADAVKSLNTGVKLIVDNKNLEGQFYSSLGEAYNELKDYAKSDENYEKALELNPKDVNVLNNYAYFLSVRGEKMDKAELMSKESNALEPDQGSYEDTYGWIMYKQGKYSEAKIWIEKSLSHGSDKSATVLEHYGDILYKLGDTNKAYEYWQKAKNAGEGYSEFLDRKLEGKKLIE